MANLQEALLKSGLADREQLKQAREEKRREESRENKRKKLFAMIEEGIIPDCDQLDLCDNIKEFMKVAGLILWDNLEKLEKVKERSKKFSDKEDEYNDLILSLDMVGSPTPNLFGTSSEDCWFKLYAFNFFSTPTPPKNFKVKGSKKKRRRRKKKKKSSK